MASDLHQMARGYGRVSAEFSAKRRIALRRLLLNTVAMPATHLIAARVSSETKERFRALAERQQVTESALLKRLVDSVVDTVAQSDGEVLRSRQRQLRGSRLCVRLNSDDQWLLRERAAARQMAAATYVSVLVRSHLRTLSPLPKAELMALTRSVAELSAIGRNINQLVRLAHQQGKVVGPSLEGAMAFIKVCEALRDHTKNLIRANTHSWEAGHEDV